MGVSSPPNKAVRTLALSLGVILLLGCSSGESASVVETDAGDSGSTLFDLSVPSDLGKDDVPVANSDAASAAPLDVAPLPEAGTVQRGPFPIVLIHGFAGF